MPQIITKEEEQRVLSTPPVVREDPPKPQDINVYATVYLEMVDTLGVQQDFFIRKADDLKSNASKQMQLLDQQDALKYRDDIPDTSDPNFEKKMKEIQIYNQKIDSGRALLQNRVVGLRQSASVTMAETNASVGVANQKGSMTTAFVRALKGIFDAIVSMTGRG